MERDQRPGESGAQQEEPRVRVMTDAERENYSGVTIDQTPDGHAYEETQDARAPYGDDTHVVFSHGDAKELRNALLRRFLGEHWKLKLIGVGTAIALAVFLVFIALPALAVFVVFGGIVFLIAQLFSF